MSKNALEGRLRAVEDEFFHQVDLKLTQQLREKSIREGKRERLSSVIHHHDDATLDQLIDLGIDEQTVAVFLLVPLVYVAWADGRVTEAERQTIADIVSRYSDVQDGPARQLFDGWLVKRPGQELWKAWEAYVQTLKTDSSKAVSGMLADQLLQHAQRVAEASSGFLRFLRMDADKQAALDRMRDALKVASS